MNGFRNGRGERMGSMENVHGGGLIYGSSEDCTSIITMLVKSCTLLLSLWAEVRLGAGLELCGMSTLVFVVDASLDKTSDGTMQAQGTCKHM
jgi:hypothetical protein